MAYCINHKLDGLSTSQLAYGSPSRPRVKMMLQLGLGEVFLGDLFPKKDKYFHPGPWSAGMLVK